MNSNIKNNDWDDNHSNLIEKVGIGNPFSTPEYYFESLSKNIFSTLNLSKVAENDHPYFTIPGEYYDNLTQVIESRIRLEEINAQKNGDGMTVDSNYFELSRKEILNKVNSISNNDGKVINLSNSWLKYAVAASIVLAITASIFLRKSSDPINSQLANLPETEIINYLQNDAETADITTLVESLDHTELSNLDQNISDEEISQYINTSL